MDQMLVPSRLRPHGARTRPELAGGVQPWRARHPGPGADRARSTPSPYRSVGACELPSAVADASSIGPRERREHARRRRSLHPSRREGQHTHRDAEQRSSARSMMSRSTIATCTAGERGSAGGVARQKAALPFEQTGEPVRGLGSSTWRQLGYSWTRTYVRTRAGQFELGREGSNLCLGIQSASCCQITPLPMRALEDKPRSCGPVPSSLHGRAFHGPHHGRRPRHADAV